jgi:Na+-driven multidrug efflux pump
VLGGIYRGLGRQKLVAALNVVGFWIVGTPLGWALTFKAGLGVGGLWWGLNASLFCTCLLGGVLMCRMDWEKAVLLTKAAPPPTEETELTANSLSVSVEVSTKSNL